MSILQYVIYGDCSNKCIALSERFNKLNYIHDTLYHITNSEGLSS